MKKITLLTVGSIKQGLWHDLAGKFEKQLKLFAKVDRRVLKEEKFQSSSEVDRVKKIEAERIREKLDKTAFSVLLTERGKELTSEELAKKLDEWSENGSRTIEFIIGGPLGLDESLDAQMNTTLSLSKMTFPHEMAQVMLLEQLYRAFTIQTGKTYHY